MKVVMGEICDLEGKDIQGVIEKYCKSKGFKVRVGVAEETYGMVITIKNEIGVPVMLTVADEKEEIEQKVIKKGNEKTLPKPVTMKCAECGFSFLSQTLGRPCPKCNSIQVVVVGAPVPAGPTQNVVQRSRTGVENITAKVEGRSNFVEDFEKAANRKKK